MQTRRQRKLPPAAAGKRADGPSRPAAPTRPGRATRPGSDRGRERSGSAVPSPLSSASPVAKRVARAPEDGRTAAEPRLNGWTLEKLGMVGKSVRVPSPLVWRVVLTAVESGNCNACALRAALEDDSSSSSSPFSDFMLECWLAVASRQGLFPATGSKVRVLIDGKWRNACVTSQITAVMPIATLSDGGAVCMLNELCWWYVFTAAVAPPEAAPAQNAAAPHRRRPLSLTSPPPGVAAVAKAAQLAELAGQGPEGRMHAAAAMVARMAEGGGVGAAFARRTLLVVNSLQTADELHERRTIHRNAVGWGKSCTERAERLVQAIRTGRLMSAAEALACRDLAREYVQQVLDTEHLAAVWGGEGGDDQHVDAWDGEEEDDEDDDYDRADDIIAASDSDEEEEADDEGEKGDASSDDEGEDNDGYSALYYKSADGVLLKPTVTAWVRYLEVWHARAVPAILADLRAAYPVAKARDVHLVMAMYGRRATAKGDRVAVPFDKVCRLRLTTGQGGLRPPLQPPDSCGGLCSWAEPISM